MPDLGVSFTRWRDPKSDPPNDDRDVLMSWENGESRIDHYRATETGGVWRGQGYGYPEPPTAWADLPRPSSAVSLEDIERVLWIASKRAADTRSVLAPMLDQPGGLAFAQPAIDHANEIDAAVARIRAALGGEDA